MKIEFNNEEKDLSSMSLPEIAELVEMMLSLYKEVRGNEPKARVARAYRDTAYHYNIRAGFNCYQIDIKNVKQ